MILPVCRSMAAVLSAATLLALSGCAKVDRLFVAPRITGGPFVVTMIDASGRVADWPIAAVIDAAGREHVVYGGRDEDLDYAVFSGSTWTREPVA